MITKKFGKPQASWGEKVVALALRIPKGRVTTYGALAKAAGGGPLSSQSVTNVLAKAYDKGEKGIPFHRIVYADGRIWIDDEHRKTRMALYKKEGIRVDARDRIVNFSDIVLDMDEVRALPKK